jgi:hypothetical protein
MATRICLDFSLFPDNTQMPQGNFTLAGFSFTMVNAGSQAFVNLAGNVLGLQFPDAGIKLKLPVPSTRISMKIGQYASPIKVEVFKAQGSPTSPALLATRVTNSPNAVTSFNFTFRQKASIVVLSGGNNEGMLVEACYKI